MVSVLWWSFFCVLLPTATHCTVSFSDVLFRFFQKPKSDINSRLINLNKNKSIKLKDSSSLLITNWFQLSKCEDLNSLSSHPNTRHLQHRCIQTWTENILWGNAQNIGVKASFYTDSNTHKQKSITENALVSPLAAASGNHNVCSRSAIIKKPSTP